MDLSPKMQINTSNKVKLVTVCFKELERVEVSGKTIYSIDFLSVSIS